MNPPNDDALRQAGRLLRISPSKHLIVPEKVRPRAGAPRRTLTTGAAGAKNRVYGWAPQARHPKSWRTGEKLAVVTGAERTRAWMFFRERGLDLKQGGQQPPGR